MAKPDTVVTGWFRKAGPPLDAPTTVRPASTSEYLSTSEDLERMTLAQLEAEYREIDGKRVWIEGEYARICTNQEEIQQQIVERLKDCGIRAEVVKKG